MDEPIQLDYADGRRTWSGPAIFALVLGIFTGPIVFALLMLTGVAYGISMVGSGIAVLVSIAISAYCIWAYNQRKREPHIRGRSLALIGLVVTAAWCVGMIALYCYVDAHLN